MIYEEITEFKKDLKQLLKRYHSLESDLEILKKYSLNLFHEQNIDTNSMVKIEGFCRPPYIAYKVRKIASRSLKKRGCNSGLRLIYIFHETRKSITLVELYIKSDKENEDRARLKRVMEQLVRDSYLEKTREQQKEDK